MTARERIALLADHDSFFELGVYAAYGMYEEWGGAPGGRRGHRPGAHSHSARDDHRQ